MSRKKSGTGERERERGRARARNRKKTTTTFIFGRVCITYTHAYALAIIHNFSHIFTNRLLISQCHGYVRTRDVCTHIAHSTPHRQSLNEFGYACSHVLLLAMLVSTLLDDAATAAAAAVAATISTTTVSTSTHSIHLLNSSIHFDKLYTRMHTYSRVRVTLI